MGYIVVAHTVVHEDEGCFVIQLLPQKGASAVDEVDEDH